MSTLSDPSDSTPPPTALVLISLTSAALLSLALFTLDRLLRRSGRGGLRANLGLDAQRRGRSGMRGYGTLVGLERAFHKRARGWRSGSKGGRESSDTDVEVGSFRGSSGAETEADRRRYRFATSRALESPPLRRPERAYRRHNRRSRSAALGAPAHDPNVEAAAFRRGVEKAFDYLSAREAPRLQLPPVAMHGLPRDYGAWTALGDRGLGGQYNRSEMAPGVIGREDRVPRRSRNPGGAGVVEGAGWQRALSRMPESDRPSKTRRERRRVAEAAGAAVDAAVSGRGQILGEVAEELSR